MKPRRTRFAPRLSRRAAVLLLLALLFAGGGGLEALRAPGASSRAATGQDVVDDLQAHLDTLEQAEDVSRVVAYRILLQYLPAGTRMTSGYRSPEKQLSLIRNYAIRRGIPVPDRMVVGEPSTWTNAWQSLRSLGFYIASPNHTPHGNPERIVFDLAGPDLGAIRRGCEVAQSKGMVKFLRPPLVEHVNGCVHIEVESFDARAFSGLSSPSQRPRIVTQQSSGGGSSASAVGAPTPTPTPLPDAEKEARLRVRSELVSQHDATPELRKKIDYDYQIIQTLDLSDPAQLSYRSVLLNEIKEHEAQAKLDEEKAANDQAAAEKQGLVAQVEAAVREGRDEEAERLAESLKGRYPELEKVHQQLVARRVIREAKGAFIDADCHRCSNVEGGACASAGELIDRARRMEEELGVNTEARQATSLKAEMEAIRSNCGWGRRTRYVLLALLVVGLGVGLYFWLRPGRYVLEGVSGPCRGEVFPLDKARMKVGAMASSEDEEVDIVISDREHKISRVHCLLTQSGRYWYVKDESRNGTKVNDLPVEKGSHQRLAGGDEISLADEAVLLFRRR